MKFRGDASIPAPPKTNEYSLCAQSTVALHWLSPKYFKWISPKRQIGFASWAILWLLLLCFHNGSQSHIWFSSHRFFAVVKWPRSLHATNQLSAGTVNGIFAFVIYDVFDFVGLCNFWRIQNGKLSIYHLPENESSRRAFMGEINKMVNTESFMVKIGFRTKWCEKCVKCVRINVLNIIADTKIRRRDSRSPKYYIKIDFQSQLDEIPRSFSGQNLCLEIT